LFDLSVVCKCVTQTFSSLPKKYTPNGIYHLCL
jgi:hypothetical protein